MSLLSSVTKIGEVIATWLDPERREKAVLRQAIDAADNLFQIQKREGKYAKMKDSEVAKWTLHYSKRWNAWKDGLS